MAECARDILEQQDREYQVALLEDMRLEAEEARQLREQADQAEQAAREACEIEKRKQEDAQLHLSPRSLRAQRLKVFCQAEPSTVREGESAVLAAAYPQESAAQCTATTRKGMRCRRCGQFGRFEGRCPQHRKS